MVVKILEIIINHNSIVINYSNESKKSMICNNIDLEGGYASFTKYNTESTGTWAINDTIRQFNGWYIAAVPYAWYTKSSKNGNSYGNCDIGIDGRLNTIPHYKGEYLCYNILNLENNKSAKIIVSETCGGNCADKDCTILGSPNMYTPINRNFPNQYCDPTINYGYWKRSDRKNVSGTGPPDNLIYYGNANDRTQCKKYENEYILDWCSGYYAHFDIDLKLIESSFANNKNSILKYERTTCPSGLPDIPPVCDYNKCIDYKTKDSCNKAMSIPTSVPCCHYIESEYNRCYCASYTYKRPLC